MYQDLKDTAIIPHSPRKINLKYAAQIRGKYVRLFLQNVLIRYFARKVLFTKVNNERENKADLRIKGIAPITIICLAVPGDSVSFPVLPSGKSLRIYICCTVKTGVNAYTFLFLKKLYSLT